MWFRFPEGTTGASVELQEFNIEVTDAEGLGYFRAPEYLAAKIIALPGFKALNPPDGLTDLDDLPAGSSPRDNAIGDLVAQVATLKSSLDDANLRLGTALRENDALAKEVAKLKATIGELESGKATKK